MIQKFASKLFSTLLSTCFAMSIRAADVSGTVSLANGSPARHAVVWLEGAAHSKPLASAMIDQRDLTFTPHVSVVTKGTTVRFPNHDTVYHNVFAEFNAKRFDLGMYPRGTSKSITFDKTGVVALLCSVHSEMSAYIMVVDTPYYAVTDGNGKFRLGGVADGSYSLHVWHEAHQSYSKSVAVSRDATFSIVTSHD